MTRKHEESEIRISSKKVRSRYGEESEIIWIKIESMERGQPRRELYVYIRRNLPAARPVYSNTYIQIRMNT